MEVYVRNLPNTMTERQVKQFFEPHLTRLGIYTFRVQKHANKPFAFLTFVDVPLGNHFLHVHGQSQPDREGSNRVPTKLFHMRRPIDCSQSHNVPDKFVLSSLRDQETRRISKVQNTKPQMTAADRGQKARRVFRMNELFCGQWDYRNDCSIFNCHFQAFRPGQLIFGRRGVVLNLETTDSGRPAQQIVMRYGSIESIITGDPDPNNPSVTFSLAEAPKLYELFPPPNEDDLLVNNLQALALQLHRPRMAYNPVKRKRISALSKAHESAVASCFCYRVLLSDHRDMRAVQALNRIEAIPRSVAYNTAVDASSTFSAQMTKLNNALTGCQFANIPFGAKFQLQRLAQNGILPPSKVVDFMSIVVQQSYGSSWKIVARAIQRLSDQIPYAGPETDVSELDLETLSRQLEENIASLAYEDSSYSQQSEQPQHIAQILKAVVTPTGVQLYGPEPEIKNRVLREYSSYIECFLQVSFLDEDWERIWYDKVTSNDDIYHERFKGIMHGIINIAGQGYEFLGFSHSSLRTQTCWFVAPFTVDSQSLYARGLIAGLGDFSKIQSPARCAARIGQAFSQTFSSVILPPESIRDMPDIERNGRVFSDGVGTCSSSVLRVIHDGYGQLRALKPSLLQIRFQGAKGMISLDDRIDDHAIYLRPSMVKFRGSKAQDIEICDAAFKPLTMYLNRQLIKILEDRGVPEDSFLSLQQEAVDRLRATAEDPVNAANFLERNHVAQSAKLPYLIRKLWDIGIIYSDDRFLRHVLEVCVLVELRELKHRSRIPVAKGMKVYGIMDETGFLQEGQVYCSVHRAEEEPLVPTGYVVVTRCPALHPGDIQCVEAVDVPQGSPLQSLQNCIVFSQHGERDLPSQLSGGDLDGDLYDIIYDDSLYPRKLSAPADYPIVKPIDIGRPVTSSDMSEFFLQFMENDALDPISVLHQTLADMNDQGVFHPDCIKLAELASTAVDFSKTGIPVNKDAIPRAPSVKPDFQAPGPGVLMENIIKIEEVDEFEDMEEIEELDEYAPPVVKYYPSQKVLGKLYRAIDEHQLFKEIQQTRHSKDSSFNRESPLDALWNYVQEETTLIQYGHYIEFAKNIKEDYEENLVNSMFNYSSQPHRYVSEVEVFSGSIIGKNGASSKPQRDFSTTMKERQERVVDYIVKCILQGEDMSGTDEALERSIACLWVGYQEVKERKRVGRLVSFAWIAASVCLREVAKFKNVLDASYDA